MTHRREPDIDAAWARWKATGDRDARNLLIEHHYDLVDQVVGHMHPRTRQLRDELISHGVLGLIDAIDKFQPTWQEAGYEQAVEFRFFARRRIRGAILDELRRVDWVGRTVRINATAVARATATLEARLGRSPSTDDVAAELGVSAGKLHTWLREIGEADVDSLDAALGAVVGRCPLPNDLVAEHRLPKDLIEGTAPKLGSTPSSWKLWIRTHRLWIHRSP